MVISRGVIGVWIDVSGVFVRDTTEVFRGMGLSAAMIGLLLERRMPRMVNRSVAAFQVLSDFGEREKKHGTSVEHNLPQGARTRY